MSNGINRHLIVAVFGCGNGHDVVTRARFEGATVSVEAHDQVSHKPVPVAVKILSELTELEFCDHYKYGYFHAGEVVNSAVRPLNLRFRSTVQEQSSIYLHNVEPVVAKDMVADIEATGLWQLVDAVDVDTRLEYAR